MNYLITAVNTVNNTSWYTIGKWSAITSFFYSFYILGYANKDVVKDYSYNKGLQLSQRFKHVKAWDKYVEPMIIHRFGIMFGAGHSFLEGLISDNDDQGIRLRLAKVDEEYLQVVDDYHNEQESSE